MNFLQIRRREIEGKVEVFGQSLKLFFHKDSLFVSPIAIWVVEGAVIKDKVDICNEAVQRGIDVGLKLALNCAKVHGMSDLLKIVRRINSDRVHRL